jgi:hypothetical protein
MSVLTASPYLVEFDEVVVVRVSAKNSYGWSATSTPNTIGAQIRRKPDQMTAPVEVSRTDSTIVVSWAELTGATTGNSAITSYNLYWDNNTGTSSLELTDSLVTQWTVTGLTSAGIYKFKVRANNIYGYGDFSAESSFEASHNPGKTAIPTVALSGTSVQVSWTEPDPHGSPITAYEVLFKKADG